MHLKFHRTKNASRYGESSRQFHGEEVMMGNANFKSQGYNFPYIPRPLLSLYSVPAVSNSDGVLEYGRGWLSPLVVRSEGYQAVYGVRAG
jgi:hypothetical protein